MESLPVKVRVFILFISLAFVVLFVVCVINFKISFVDSLQSIRSITIILSLLVADILADLFPIVYSVDTSENKAEITLTFSINFAIAVLFSPLIAIMVSFLVSIISDTISRKQIVKMIFNSTKISLAVCITSLFFYNNYFYNLPLTNPKNLSILGLGFLIYLFLDSSLLFGLLSILNKKPFVIFWFKNLRKVFLTLLAFFAIGLVIIFFFQTQPLMNLFIIPTFIAVYLALKRDVQVTQETEQALYTLAEIVDARIPDTMFHSERVAQYTKDFCNALNIDDDVTNLIVMSAKLHDIGKIAIPDKILWKPSKLTKDEYEVVKYHPIDGANIAASLTKFRKGATLIKYHHEHYDGQGYPDKVREENIPLGARIIAIVDAFDTMTTPRNYNRNPRTIDEALEEIRINAGTQFDPHISEVFIKMVKDNKEKYQEIINDACKKIEAWLSQE